MMMSSEFFMSQKYVALVAHDSKKSELLEWVNRHKAVLSHHKLFATGTTGSLIMSQTGLKVTQFRSGPKGGDQEIGAAIVNGRVNILIFFTDPMSAQPHGDDVRALLRIATLNNIPIAQNTSTADFLLSSPHFNNLYQPKDDKIEDENVPKIRRKSGKEKIKLAPVAEDGRFESEWNKFQQIQQSSDRAKKAITMYPVNVQGLAAAWEHLTDE